LLFVLPDLGARLFGVVDVLVGFVVVYLRVLAGFDWLAWQSAFGRPTLVISMAASVLLLAPLPGRHRMLLLLCVMLPVIPAPLGVEQPAFRVIVLDVGQGLAVLVDTARHRLLYDAGPRSPAGLDVGRAVVVPSLRATGPARIDVAVLSHADMDHVGGFPAIAAAMPVHSLLGGEPVTGAAALQPCKRGQGWQWDGVRFVILHPAEAMRRDNDRSCVLLIDNGSERVLLPGDISGIAEYEVAPLLSGAPIDLMVAAHHGSRTSSTWPFLHAALPRVVVVSAGHLNRFGHPHPDVVCRLNAAGAQVFSTAQSGALEWRSPQPLQLREWRAVAPPYWRVGINAGRLICPEGSR